MDNNEFLQIIKNSFNVYLNKGTSRSTGKLKPLHGGIAKDIKERLGEEFEVISQGYGNNTEYSVKGRYYDKKTDITVLRNGKPVAAYAVKFVMRNYAQNSNNYFEGMLGETANLRTNSVPYFQIFIIFDKVPYFERNGKFKKYDIISEHNMGKYLALSKDNPDIFFHTPEKILFVVVKLKDKRDGNKFADESEYAEWYKSIMNDNDIMEYFEQTKDTFGNGVIYNDYEDFMQRTYHIIMGKIKK